MSEVIVNWGEAPEGATHYGYSTLSGMFGDWYIHENHTWKYWDKWDDSWCDCAGNNNPAHRYIIARPVVDETAWTPGKDLPPIGTTVALVFDSKAEHSNLYKVDCKAGYEVEIIAHFTNKLGVHLAAYVSYADGVGFVKQGIAQMFKALPTQEEKYKEVRRKAVNQIIDDLGYPTHGEARDTIKALYDKWYLDNEYLCK